MPVKVYHPGRLLSCTVPKGLSLSLSLCVSLDTKSLIETKTKTAVLAL